MQNAIVTLSLFFITSAYSLGQLETTARERESTANAKDEEAIQKVLAQQAEAWNRHDAKAFSMVFAEDADFTNVVGMSAHGRSEIEKFHAPMFATRFKDTHLKITNTKIRFIKPDVAAVDGWWEMTGAKTQGKEIPLRRGLLNFVMTKEGGHWFITVMHNMDLPAANPN
jgi:uncharacterized protein (TIGR02246 family)